MSNIIPKTHHAAIKICRILLQDPSLQVTTDHFSLCQEILSNHLYNEKLSPKDINNLYNLDYRDFGMTIKKVFKIKLRTLNESKDNYLVKSGKKNTSEKHAYFRQCTFKFEPHKYPEISGYELFTSLGMYHKKNNKNGVQRDHLVSKSYGWHNKIDASIISHPANCQYLTALDNQKKYSNCAISLEELQYRIIWWAR